MKRKILLMIFLCVLAITALACENKEKEISFHAEFYKSLMGKTHSSLADNPEIYIIHDKNELNDYYEKNKEHYDLSKLKENFSRYDEEYFKKQDLIFIVFQEPGSAISHEVRSVKYVDDTWEVTIQKNRPEAGVTNMAWWHLALEINQIKLGTDSYTDQIKINVLDETE